MPLELMSTSRGTPSCSKLAVHSGEKMQWRRRSKTQEGFLQELERCNKMTQRAVVTRNKSDLRRIVHDGRALVRNWPSSPPPTVAKRSNLPMTRKSRRHQELLLRQSATPAEAVIDTSNSSWGCPGSKEGESEGKEVGDRSCPPSGASSAVYPTVTGDQDELFSQYPPSPALPSTIESFKQGCASSRNGVPPEQRDPIRKTQERVRDSTSDMHSSSKSCLADAPTATEPSGWFWGADRYNPGDGGSGGGDMGDVGVAAPGRGTMAAFWRGTKRAHGAPGHRVAIGPCAAVASGISTQDTRYSCPQGASGKPASITGNTPYGANHPLKERYNYSSNSSSKTLISIASAKAAVRSASNRGAELSRLLSEGNKPPREECLAKAESAVRAAQSAISCANERLFELELMVATSSVSDVPVADVEPVGRDKDHTTAVSDVHKSEKVEGGMNVTPGNPIHNNEERHGDQGSSSTTRRSSPPTSSLFANIEQLTEQMEIAQSLQAASIAARARLSRRFELEDAAAVRLQAVARGRILRWREMCKNTKMAELRNTKRSKIRSIEEPSIQTRLQKEEKVGDGREGGTVEGEEGSDTAGDMLPRREELWWTLAEVENADEIEDQESEVLRAIEKLQAIVRSRLTRSKIIAAVNTRFVEHFDDEYQQPFFV